MTMADDKTRELFTMFFLQEVELSSPVLPLTTTSVY
jgi:hypothetical protein